MGRKGLGVPWQGVLSPACQSLLHRFTRLSSEPRRAPTLPVGNAGVWELGKGGRLEPVHLKGTSTLHTCQAQENAPQSVCHRGRNEGEKGRREGKSVPSQEKALEGRRSSRTHTRTRVHARTHTFSLSLSLGLLSQITALVATAILEVGDLGKRQGVEAQGASMSLECWEQTEWWGTGEGRA